MTRLEFLLNGPLRYPEDVQRLRESISELAEIPSLTIESLYANWSDDLYCASWLILDEGIQEFATYLREEV